MSVVAIDTAPADGAKPTPQIPRSHPCPRGGSAELDGIPISEWPDANMTAGKFIRSIEYSVPPRLG